MVLDFGFRPAWPYIPCKEFRKKRRGIVEGN